LISGVLRADHGQILIDGEDVYENEKIKKGIFFLPDDPYYTANVCANDLADLYRATHDFNEEIFRGYLDGFKLNAKKPIRNFSKGMKRQVFVALALAVQPKYLLLDEAFDGLDPLARLTLKRSLAELVEQKNTTVIISSHSLRELEDFCDSYGIIDHGKMTSSGDLEDSIGKVHKFQAAFDREVADEELAFCMSVSKTGRVVQMTARGDKEEIMQKIQALKPLFVEEIQMDFEEMFIGEVQSRGYMQ
jgi:ABC-2 type transport system ATP-binding protein